jgi:hypothetical protein
MSMLQESSTYPVTSGAHERVHAERTIAETARTTRRLLLAGAVGALGFVGVALIEGATRPGYSAWTHYVSELSLSDQGWLQIVNFIASGILIVCGAVGLARTLERGPGAVWGPRLIGIFGVGLVAAGVFVMDPTHGYPEGLATRAPQTLHGVLHGVAGLVCFTSLGLAALVLARRFARGWAIYSALSGLIVLGFFVTSTASDVLAKTGTIPESPTGLLQRVAIVAGWGWLALLLLRLRGQSSQ